MRTKKLLLSLNRIQDMVLVTQNIMNTNVRV